MYGDPEIIHEPSGLKIYKRPALADVSDASDVFTLTDSQESIGLGTFDKRHGKLIESRFTGYVSMPLYADSGGCKLTDAALDAIAKRVFGYLSCSLQVSDWGKNREDAAGWSLITADWNEIIGGVWLAIVRTDSLPHRVSPSAND